VTRSTTVVQVFVASPSDVKSERDILEALIAELNRTWSATLGVIFELVRWETHVRPSLAADPQAVVNAQIGDSYDVFIGILWGRFGTPTPRAPSGTIEEFERALAKLRNGDGKPEIMIYFKDAPLPPSRIDPVQLQLLQNFRASLSHEGMYSVFEDELGFQTSLRAHLAALAKAFASSENNRGAQPPGPMATRTSLTESEDDLGYLDYIETYESRIAEMTSTMQAISDATVRVGELVSQRASDIGELAKPISDVKTARKHVKMVADDMTAYAEILNQQLPLMSSSRETALQALTRALTFHDEFSTSDETALPTLRASLATLMDAATGSMTGLRGFRSSLEGLPRMTADLNRAKRAVLSQLDSMLSEIYNTVHTIENILESVDRMVIK